MNQKDSSYHFGFVEIYTKEIHVSKAKKIISEMISIETKKD